MIRKQNLHIHSTYKEAFFAADSPKYQSWAIEAAEAQAGKIPFFEANTGAISRRYQTTPYPAPFLLDTLKRLRKIYVWTAPGQFTPVAIG